MLAGIINQFSELILRKPWNEANIVIEDFGGSSIIDRKYLES